MKISGTQPVLTPQAGRVPLLHSMASIWARMGEVQRRQGWFLENLTARKLFNLLVALVQFGLKHEKMKAWPLFVKIDISPLCNLHCPGCVHARASETSRDELKFQRFEARQKMSLPQFQRILNEITGRSLAVSLYYVGDPYMHPDIDAMCRMAKTANLNCHISTNFSFRLSDERIQSIVDSGLTHLTVCVDGMTQQTYERTRAGGHLAWVLHNLERVITFRNAAGQRYPNVEVQFLIYEHNASQVRDAIDRFSEMGVDQFTSFWGDLHNYTDLSPGTFKVHAPKRNRGLPQCLWPHFSLQIRHDGNVVPCVNYRMGPQYSAVGEKRTVGNVFKTSVRDVWNSPAYQSLRRFSSNPERSRDEPALGRTFCDGCPQLFHTEIANNIRRGDFHKWDEFFQIDETKRVTPKM